MDTLTSRRRFLKGGAAAAAGFAVLGSGFPTVTSAAEGARAIDPLYKLSLAQWSLHRTLRASRLDNLDFAAAAKNQYEIEAVEYVNQFFQDKAQDRAYLEQMKRRAEDHGVRSLLIMIDGEGRLGDPDEPARIRAVENHFKWVEAARFLGCHSIRVNAESRGSYEQQQRLAVDGLQRLCDFAKDFELNVLVENHGGLSSNGQWLAEVMTQVQRDNGGTLPDFGNFNLGGGRTYDRYLGVEQLMPFAKAVSAKSHDFDEEGNEVHTDYRRMMRIVVQAGYRGFIGIEYEGRQLPEPEGIRATKRLLERVHDELAAEVDRQP